MRRSSLLLVAACVVAFAGCGGSGDSPADQTQTTARLSEFGSFCAQNPGACEPQRAPAAQDEPQGVETVPEAPVRAPRQNAPTKGPASPPQRGPRCDGRDFSGSRQESPGPMTGEHSLVIRLRKHGGAPCVLNGYPQVTLNAKGRRLSFDYANYREGSNGYGHGPAASRQELRTGTSVSFIATKYRCDVGTQATADEILIRLPHVTRPVRVRLPPTDRGVMALSYCTPADGSRTDPGDLVTLSALARHLFDR